MSVQVGKRVERYLWRRPKRITHADLEAYWDDDKHRAIAAREETPGG